MQTRTRFSLLCLVCLIVLMSCPGDSLPSSRYSSPLQSKSKQKESEEYVTRNSNVMFKSQATGRSHASRSLSSFSFPSIQSSFADKGENTVLYPSPDILRFRRDSFSLLTKKRSTPVPSLTSSSSGQHPGRRQHGQQQGWKRKERASSLPDVTSASSGSFYRVLSSPSTGLSPTTGSTEDQDIEQSEAFLDVVDEITRGARCSLNRDGTPGDTHVFLPKSMKSVSEIPASEWKLKSLSTANRVSLLSSIMSSYSPKTDDFKLLRSALDQLVRLDHEFFQARIAWFHPKDPFQGNTSFLGYKNNNNNLQTHFFVNLDVKRRFSSEIPNRVISLKEAWMQLPTEGKKNQYLHQLLREGSVLISRESFSRDELNFAEWSPIYYSCELKKWIMSFTSLIVSDSEQQNSGSNIYQLKGVISVDVDISSTDFNQCDVSLDDDGHSTEESSGLFQSLSSSPLPMYGTHKCDRISSLCVFHSGLGWRRGGYACVCRNGFYSSSSVNEEEHSRHFFNGSLLEYAWKLKNQQRGLAYDMIYTCKKCPEGCDSCTDASQCLSTSNWFFTVSLVVICILALVLVMLLAYYTCWY